MPQLFQVLKCYKCSVFQVHQTKKSNKWQCKLCGEKQSIKRHYGIGTGKECRMHVQKLNEIRGEINDHNESLQLNKSTDEHSDMENENCDKLKTYTKTESKWSSFVEEIEQHQVEDDDKMFIGNTEVVLEVPKKKRKKFNAPKLVQEQTESIHIPINKTENNKLKYHEDEIIHKPAMPIFNKNPVLKVNSPQFSTNIKSEEDKCFSKDVAPIYLTQNDCIDKNYNDIKLQSELDTYVPPKVNKHSKWAQFAEESENEDNLSVSEETLIDNIPLINKKTLEKANNIFSLCDESEMDDVLDL